MKALLLIAMLMTSLTAADLPTVELIPETQETVVLTDGRRFVGWYDPMREVLTLASPRAELRVTRDQIASRTPSDPVAPRVDAVRNVEQVAVVESPAEAQERTAQAVAAREARRRAEEEAQSRAEFERRRDAERRADFYRRHGITFDPATMDANAMDKAAEPIIAQREAEQAQRDANQARRVAEQRAERERQAELRERQAEQRRADIAEANRIQLLNAAEQRRQEQLIITEKERAASRRELTVFIFRAAFIVALFSLPVIIAKLRKHPQRRHITMIWGVTLVGVGIASALFSGVVWMPNVFAVVLVLETIAMTIWACWPRPSSEAGK